METDGVKNSSIEDAQTMSAEDRSGEDIDDLSRRWREEGLRYASAINALHESGTDEDWTNAEENLRDGREPLADAVMTAVRNANTTGNFDRLHERFPPAYGPFAETFGDFGQAVPIVILLDDGRILLRIGEPWDEGHFAIIDGLQVERLSDEIISVGRSPNRRYFAVARKSGVTIHDGWNGPATVELKWPTGLEGIPEGFEVAPLEGAPPVTRLIPFPQGDRALLISIKGVFVLEADRAVRLLPTKEEMRRFFEWLKEKHPDDGPLARDLTMAHGAISPEGRLIATGHQDSAHLLFETGNYDLFGQFSYGGYSHHAAFSTDGRLIAFNSCHFYNGETFGIPIDVVPDLKTDPDSIDHHTLLDDRATLLEDTARVYAAVHRGDEFIIGDAYGYLKAFTAKESLRWQHFIGPTIADIDISRDGRQLVVSTYAGVVSIIDLDTGEADPFVIGTATHRERRRWLFLEYEDRPLGW